MTDGRDDSRRAAEPTRGQDASDQPARPHARELVRRRSGTYRAPETGRHHHIGAAPQRQPVLGDAPGAGGYVEVAAVQLAGRTVVQLRRQRERHARLMQQSAADLDFEEAARQRDAASAVDAELERRRGQNGPAAPGIGS